MPPKQTQIHVSNIYSQARNEEVEGLLQSIGPVVEWQPKREGDIKFSCTAEYYDEFTAMIAFEMLNGFKFQGRELKVKLHGNIGAPKILPYAIEKVNYKTSNTYGVALPIEEFYSTLTMNKKMAIFIDLKQTFSSHEDLLERLLSENPKMAEFVLKIQKDVLKEFKQESDEFQQNHYSQFQNHHNNRYA